MNSSVVINHPVASKWDIFCRIVDNYGDIGVCWRLAKQLVNEHHLAVRLFIDLPEIAQKIIPDLNTSLAQQMVGAVEIRVWDDALFSKEGFIEGVADVVIEAFACGLPEQYSAAIQFSTTQSTIWMNLEYLSAEKWVDDFHTKPSVNPDTGLIKHYFFPGFNAHTGGLLREVDLMARRDVFHANKTLQLEFLQQFNLNLNDSNAIKISLFCYLNACIGDMLEVLTSRNQEIILFVPDDAILEEVLCFFGEVEGYLYAKKVYKKGCLSLYVMPFLSQDDYDKLLWTCDINFVRGEDSWIRAIWAARPFIWQPYFQQEETHTVKLDAFLDNYCQQLEVSATTALHNLNHAWISPANGDCFADYWNEFIKQLEVCKAHAQVYTKRLSEQADLASKLVKFCNK